MEPGNGNAQEVLRVHRLGWMRGEVVVRPASVTVLDGGESEGSPAPKRRRRPRGDDELLAATCKHGTPGCQGDCLGCLADEPEENPFEEKEVEV